METLGPKPYQAAAIKWFKRTCATAGKRILEVGGCNFPADYIKGEIAPKIWVSVDMLDPTVDRALQSGGENSNPFLAHLRAQGVRRPNGEDINPNGDNSWYIIVDTPIHNFDTKPFGKFDYIFSVAAFEHIHNLDTALSVMFDSLRSGGVLCTRFSPIWSSADGHHCKRMVENAKTKATLFGANGNIPPHAHLIWGREEMQQYLETYYDATTTSWLIHSIYDGPYINRLFFDDYVDAIKNSRFRSSQVQGIWPAPPAPDTEVQLRRRHPSHMGFEFQGVEIIAMKEPKISVFSSLLRALHIG